jgi:hypothetical protein
MKCNVVVLDYFLENTKLKKYKRKNPHIADEQSSLAVSTRNSTQIGNICFNEQDKIDIINNRVGELKQIALEMGKKIESNNCIIDEIIVK